MSVHWISGKMGAASLSAAVIAVAATPEEAQSPHKTLSTQSGPVRMQAAAINAAPAANVDMARLRRLQPIRAIPEEAQQPTPAVVGNNALPNPATPQEEKETDQEMPSKAEVVNVFVTKTWYVPPPPPPPAKPAPPPKPTAPPVPFVFMGRYDDEESPTVIMLVRGDRLYTVSVGETIDDTYRVERVETGRIELTYLPLKQKQILQTGETG